MSGPGRLYTIAADRSFVDSFAAGLLARYRAAPLRLAEAVLLLPTRRAVRALREAFLRQSDGRPLILPAMHPLGDIDEYEPGFGLFASELARDLPPAIAPLRRQLLLGRLIRAARTDLSEAQALDLALELGRFLDQLQLSGLGLDRLGGLAPADFAGHWQQTLDFLALIDAPWRDILAAEGTIDAVARRDRIVQALAELWRARPPDSPVIAAGSTGSVPTTARLLALIARLPAGEVVLPGLDRELDDDSWTALKEDHPQFALRELLSILRAGRGDVMDWPDAEAADDRRRDRLALLSAVTLPAETSERWRGFSVTPRAVDGLTRVDAADSGEEARIIALLMRRTLETPGARAALVTPDRGLGRRVAAELKRWTVEVDDSAGTPLGETPAGAFLRLAATAVAEAFAPHPLLALGKHPLARAGLPAGRFRMLVRQWERAALRGPRPAPGLDGLETGLRAGNVAGAALQGFLDFRARAEPFAAAVSADRVSPRELLHEHVAFAEWLSRDEDGVARLWQGEDGETAAQFVHELDRSLDGLPPLAGADYAGAFDSLLAGAAVRPAYGRHPRLAIWGPLEARLQHVDLMILGGLNEGSWPALPRIDPWLNRPMRRELEMPAPEWRIGLAAHDFVQAASAPDVVLTRAERVDGAPTVPSRWLLRLEQVMTAAGLDADTGLSDRLRHWAAALDRPASIKPVAAPKPSPPREVRPRQLSVTRIQTWLQNPYGLYASEILKLKPLDEIDADPTLAERGTAIHAALERFVRSYGESVDDPLAALLDHGRAAFGEMLAQPSVRAFWWPRFERLAAWFVAQEAARRPELARSLVELRGVRDFDGPGGRFRLTATADRLDRRHDGGVEILDYKSGTAPTAPQVARGDAPQLALEALIAAGGGFPELGPCEVTGLSYWRLSGGRAPGEVRTLRLDLAQVLADAEDGMQRLIAAFDRAETPYHARPRPDLALPYDDYEHLARLREWGGA